MIKGIPPSIRGVSTGTQYKIRKVMPHYTRMHTNTLENLLGEAQKLELEQLEVVKFLNDNEELEKLDRLRRVIMQIKVQIATRKKCGG